MAQPLRAPIAPTNRSSTEKTRPKVAQAHPREHEGRNRWRNQQQRGAVGTPSLGHPVPPLGVISMARRLPGDYLRPATLGPMTTQVRDPS